MHSSIVSVSGGEGRQLQKEPCSLSVMRSWPKTNIERSSRKWSDHKEEKGLVYVAPRRSCGRRGFVQF